ncbi:uncharacterized protein MELLADRAFT_57314 [Melampsora larici-populina 98AG31]|uniref:Uncharacterized protein n=1 Tax=Melampsora larici-populina (strain 98AG31 / pathotype 3-4-7) TaxID=747676 RepID=F4S0W6_MELLP|nr:uncharacterized protein MELLADRAFT_57314 [Melampsora larici-populina 98AG31]EGG01661.1 hypothetical protein MELLADRAFT_57314 [Melampsora larici-populina 98AG31]
MRKGESCENKSVYKRDEDGMSFDLILMFGKRIGSAEIPIKICLTNVLGVSDQFRLTPVRVFCEMILNKGDEV